MTVALVAIVLILLNALYVAAEFGAVGVRKGRVRELAAEGHFLAKRLRPIVDDARALDRWISACQIGITVTSLALGAYGEAHLSDALVPLFDGVDGLGGIGAHSLSTAVVLLGLTFLQIVIGELVPKQVALSHPTSAALVTVTPIEFSRFLFAPLIHLFNGLTVALLRAFGIPTTGQRHVHSPEEIEFVLDESRAGGVIAPSDATRLVKALRLGMRTARQLMVPRREMEMLDLDQPASLLLRQVAHSPYTRLPAWRGTRDDIVGVVHSRDVVRSGVDGEAAIASLVQKPLFVPDSATADRVLGELRRTGHHLALVVNEYGGIEGLITLEDVLAELFGELSDELKASGPAPAKLPDGRVRIPGRTLVDETAALLGVRWQGDADTVGGLVQEVLGRLPRQGETLEIAGVPVVVERVSETSVESVLAEPLWPRSELGDDDTR